MSHECNTEGCSSLVHHIKHRFCKKCFLKWREDKTSIQISTRECKTDGCNNKINTFHEYCKPCYNIWCNTGGTCKWRYTDNTLCNKKTNGTYPFCNECYEEKYLPILWHSRVYRDKNKKSPIIIDVEKVWGCVALYPYQVISDE